MPAHTLAVGLTFPGNGVYFYLGIEADDLLFDKDINVANQFTGRDYKPGRDAGRVSIPRVGDSLGVAYRSTTDFVKRHYKAALGAAVGLSIMGAAERVDGGIVDLDWRLAEDYSNISYLADKDELDPAVTASYRWENPYGSVLFSDSSDVPRDWRLILLDNGGQPVGIQVITTKGAYNTFLYGDIPSTTTIDEGAPKSTPISVIARSPDNKVLAANFDPSYTFIDLRNVVNRNIMVSGTEIPEPTALALLGAGAGMAALMRRSRK